MRTVEGIKLTITGIIARNAKDMDYLKTADEIIQFLKEEENLVVPPIENTVKDTYFLLKQERDKLVKNLNDVCYSLRLYASKNEINEDYSFALRLIKNVVNSGPDNVIERADQLYEARKKLEKFATEPGTKDFMGEPQEEVKDIMFTRACTLLDKILEEIL